MVSDVLKKSSTAEDRNNHEDIADLLIRQYRSEHLSITPVEEKRDPMKNPTFLKIKEYVRLGCEEEFAFLIDNLGLKMVGVRRFWRSECSISVIAWINLVIYYLPKNLLEFMFIIVFIICIE